MYKKALKETASQLKVLAVLSENSNQESADHLLVRFFKEITFASNSEEAMWLYSNDHFDLILIDYDDFDGDVFDFILNIQKKESFQPIVISSRTIDDNQLLYALLNSHIAAYLYKNATIEERSKVLSKVCAQAYDRKLLQHYLEDLERQQEAALHVSCGSSCPMQAQMRSIHEVKPPIHTFDQDNSDDDFMFIIDNSSAVNTEGEHSSLYQDYFTFLEHDDREELYDQLNDIDASLVNAFSSNDGNVEYINRLGTSLIRYGNVLLRYQFFSDIGAAILDFGKTISDEAETVAMRADEFQMLISGFCSGLQIFMSEVWEKESENPKFFNDSLINDVRTIIGMLAPVVDNDDDLVFF